MERKAKSNNKFLPPRKLATNKSYTLCINDFGDLYSWGSNADSRLGHKIENKSNIVENAKKYDYFSNLYTRLLEVGSGESHIAVVALGKNDAHDEAGTLYTWGLPLYGRLGYIDETGADDIEYNHLMYKTIPKKVNIPDKVVRVACGTDFTACITVKGQLYTWGTNKSGYLGVENITYEGDQSIVSTPTLVRSLINKVIIQVACGSKHMMCLTSDRNVFSWGSGEDGILGHGNSSGLNKPELIKELKNDEIIFIVAGDFSSGAVNNHGHLYTWGRGKYGILGHGSEETHFLPKRVYDSLEYEKVVYVSLGFYHSLCSTIDKKTFAWGYSEKGRLGCIEKSDCDQKKRIPNPREIHVLRGNTIAQLYAGLFHSFAIAANTGKLWGWGENNDCILGSIEDDEVTNTNKKSKKVILYKPIELKTNKNLVRISGGIEDLYEVYYGNTAKLNSNINLSDKSKLKKLACGGSHTIALTSTDDVYAWGYGEEGQLGLQELKCSTMPSKVEFGGDRKIMKIYAGYIHSMAITRSSEVFVWGDGRQGQLARIINSSNIPISIDDLSGLDIKKGSCGYDNCAVVSSDGKLFVWGGNASFKLGLSNSNNDHESNPRHIEVLTSVKKVSCGFSHTAAINTNGELYTWGHGFYGQLGHGDILTIKEPLKVFHNDLKYKKVRCGSYQTVAVSKKDHVYIWGRGGINLNRDPTKHKVTPEIVEDFKNIKIIDCQAGNGNSLILTEDQQIFSWGDNTDGKAGGLEVNFVTKQAKEIKIENDNKKRQLISKIFAGYSHCFAIGDNGDLFGWGSSKCFRLTSDYGDNQQFEPKLINLTSGKLSHNTGNNNPDKNESNNNEKINNKSLIDERYIMARLYDKRPITNFRELQILIENDDIKFSDKKQKERDEELQIQMINGLRKLSSSNVSISTDKYMHYDKLLYLRTKNLKVPRPKMIRKSIPQLITENINEIENIYTLFYLHPCLFKDYFEEEITPTNFSDFLTGIKPMFKDMQLFSQKVESLDNVIFLTFFKFLIEHDLKMFNYDIDKLYVKMNSFAEYLLEIYFYNSYGRSILLDVFEKSFKDLYLICLNHVKKNKNKKNNDDKNIKATYYRIQAIFKNQNSGTEQLKKENIEEIINIMKAFINDFESNLSKIPIYVLYGITKTKKIFYKRLLNPREDSATIKENKQKIKRGVLRLFYKNILARLLNRLCSLNNDFLKLQLKIKDDDESTDAYQMLEQYIIIIGEFLIKISQKKLFSVSSDDREETELFNLLDNNIKDFYDRVNNIFKQKIIKSKFDLKKESLSSIIYWNSKPNVKNFKITLKDLIAMLKIINKAKFKSKPILGMIDFNKYRIFDLFEPETLSFKSNIEYDQTLKISLFTNTKFLLDPNHFAQKFSKEIKFTGRQSDTEIGRCKLCNLIIPNCFILNSPKKDNYLIKTFENKISQEYLKYINEVVRDKAFPREMSILKTEDFREAVRELAEKKQKEDSESARLLRSLLDDFINKTDMSGEELYSTFLSDIFNHLKVQHKHYNFINIVTKVLNDIEDANTNYISKINSINKELDNAIKGICAMEVSLDFFDDDKDRVEENKAKLTHVSLGLKDYPVDSNKLRYKMLTLPVTVLKENKVLLSHAKEGENDKDLIIQIVADSTNKIFDIKVNQKKTKEVILSYNLNYDDFVYANINSNCFTSISSEKFKFNNVLLIQTLHKQISDYDGK